MHAKQVIVLRKDLGMRKGKMVAQGAHASMKVFLDRGAVDAGTLTVTLTPAMEAWLTGRFTKICVRADDEAHLLALAEAAETAGVPHGLIRDSGKTEFHGVPTYTALAIGPAELAAVDAITGDLQLW
ncbi:MAG: aminoacyl-tRNA hydrolase [Bradymonadia bacterium]